ncbi:hypothetical protein CYK37_11810 [Mesorhizobium loti]|nr:hypothetical protein [Mesorhizobium loti]PLP59157.1 hypothetical protein CYK37_11810 [Mesorhizobium loti]
MILGKTGTDDHVVERGAVSVAANARALDASDRVRIILWLELNQIAPNVAVQAVAFENAASHCEALQPLLADLRARFGGPDLAILYLHRGHQLDTRSPILQQLLHLVGATGPVFALRADNDVARRDAKIMSRALLHCHGRILVLADETRRLCLQSAIPPVITYTILYKQGVRNNPPGQAVVENLEVHL